MLIFRWATVFVATFLLNANIAQAFTASDLQGTWNYLGLISGDAPSQTPGWYWGTLSADDNCNISFPASITDSLGNSTYTPGVGACNISPAGVVTIPGPTFHGVMSSTKETVFSVATMAPGSITGVSGYNLQAWVKRGGTFTTSDLQGTWNYHMLTSGDGLSSNGWQYGTISINSSGAMSFTSITRSNGDSTLPGPESLSITSTGVVSHSINASFHGVMSGDKSIIVATVTDGPGGYALAIMQKSGGTFTTSDLQGKWNMHVLSSGDSPQWTGWGYGTGNFNGDGVYTPISMTRSDGNSSLGSARNYSVTSSGNLTVAGWPSFHGVMSQDKSVIVATVTDGGGGYDIVIFQSSMPRSLNDFDGDGLSDIAVWRPSNGTWYVKPSSGSPPMVTQWGDQASGDIPFLGDFDGDGKADAAVWRPSNGTWYVKPSSGVAPMVAQWGDNTVGDKPFPGDYDGDGKTDFAVWRASNGTWYVKPSSGVAPLVVQWGDQASGDIPVPGDYDGDGKTDFAVWRPSNGTWYVRLSSGAAPMVAQWGDQAAGDIPVIGDYDGDGKTDFAVWRPSNGTWYVMPSSGIAAIVTQWGDQPAGDKPVPGDYDGDGKTDVAVWRPSNGSWYVKPSSDTASIVTQWGDQASGDKPVNRPVHLWGSP
jgi:hypothetical protein